MNDRKKKNYLPYPLAALLIYVLLTLALILSLKYLTLFAAPLFFSFVIAYLFIPVVNKLERKTHLPRGFITGVLMILLVVVTVIILAVVFPRVLQQVENAAEKFPNIMERFSQKVRVVNNYIIKKFSPYVGPIDLVSKVENTISQMRNKLSNFVITIFSGLYSVVIALLYTVFVPLFSYYFIKDYRKIMEAIFGLIPPRINDVTRQKINQLHDIFSAFIHGQAIIVLILACLYSIGLNLIKLPFSILIGVFSGIGDIIPYFGTIVGLIVSLIVGLANYDSVEKVLLILLVFAIVKGSENWFFYPKIVGKEVGLHFLWVVVAIISFGRIFGFWGLLVAIPASAGLKVFIEDLVLYYKNSHFFKKEKYEQTRT
ncbi:MAG: AI-2E family transporter [Acidobacteria bacterium]|jgi:predicted PurR-regulated permease PerM|nr:AI-2E family transporter [Acidobacteriota bacterium]